jgi:DICT domain-containing protein
VTVLRTWEERYGLPRPLRTASGRRRYSDSDCVLLGEVLRWRAGGLSLPAAMARAAEGTADKGLSIFAGVRRRHPGVAVHLMFKPMLLALTRAVEDECFARAEKGVFLGAFQRREFYRQSQHRWQELARTAAETVVFSDFGTSADGTPVEVALDERAPMRREWALVCDGGDVPAMVCGWEVPGLPEAGDGLRRFEVLWSVDPEVVRDASLIGAAVAGMALPDVGTRLASQLEQGVPPASADLRRASGVLERMLGYLTH